MIDIFDELLAYEQEQNDPILRMIDDEKIVNNLHRQSDLINHSNTKRENPAQRLTRNEMIENRRKKDEATLDFINEYRVASWKAIRFIADEPRTTILSRLESLVYTKQIKKVDSYYARKDYQSSSQNKHNLVIAGLCSEIIFNHNLDTIIDTDIRSGGFDEWKFSSQLVLSNRYFIPDIVILDKKIAIEVELSRKSGKAKTKEFIDKINAYRLTDKFQKVQYYTDSTSIIRQLEKIKVDTCIGDKLEIVRFNPIDYI